MYCTSTSPAAASYCSSRFAMLSFLCLVLIFIVTHSSAPAQNDTSCGLVWGPIIQLSRDSIANYRPQICTQGDTIHVTWWGSEDFYKLPYARSTNGGLSFEPVRDLLQNYPSFVQAPYEKIVANKNTVFLFIAGTSGQGLSPVYVLRSSDAGANWGSPVPIMNDTTGQLLYASIKGDTILVIYRENYNSSEWKFSISTNGGNNWFSPQSSVMTWYADKVEVGSEYLYRLYGDTVRGEVLFTKSNDLGNTWSSTMRISSNDIYPSSEITIGLGELNRIYAAWRDPKYGCIDIGCSIPFRFSDDNGDVWSGEILLTDQPDGLPTDGGKFAIKNGIIAFVWTKTISPSNAHIQFRYSLDTGNAWSPLCFPTGFSSTERSGHPVSAISTSGFHIVWSKFTEAGTWGIFYRRASLLSSIVNEPEEMPNEIQLEQNYPNPFNPITTIKFSIPLSPPLQRGTGGLVSLKVYDIFGKEIAALMNKQMEAGEHSVEWNAEKSPSGLYFYRLSITDTKGKVFSQTKKMMLMK